MIFKKGQTIKPLSVKKEHHCPYTTKPGLLSLSHRQEKETEELLSEGSPPHLFCHCLGWEGTDEDSSLGGVPPAPEETVGPEGNLGTFLERNPLIMSILAN